MSEGEGDECLPRPRRAMVMVPILFIGYLPPRPDHRINEENPAPDRQVRPESAVK